MDTIILKDVPKDFIKEYWKIVSYDFFVKKINQNNEKIIYWNDEEIDNMWKTSSIFSNSF